MTTSVFTVYAALLALALPELPVLGFGIPSHLPDKQPKQGDAIKEIQPYSEPFVRCIDDTLDWPLDWTRTAFYSPEEGNLPDPFKRQELNASGLYYFSGTGAGSIEWPKYNLAPGHTEYFYARYVLYRPGPYYLFPEYFDDVMPGVNASIFEPSERIQWQETCFILDYTNTNRRSIQKRALDQNGIFILDKMIYLSLPPDRAIQCGRTEFQDILQYCNNFLPNPPASTSPITTETTSEVPPPPPHEETTHWIDVQQDLQRLQWTSVGSSLRYADCSKPTSEGPSTTARGVFVLEGRKNEGAQELVSTRLNSGQSYLYLRYYVHHVSSNEKLVQKYYVMPAADQVKGVEYLDSTPDSKWKEAFVRLDASKPFVVRIGTSSKDPRDRLLIDKIIVNQRQDGRESSC